MVELQHHSYTLACVNHWERVSQLLSEWVSQWMGESVSQMAGPGGKLPTHGMFVESNWREGILPVCLSAPVSQMCWSETSELNSGGDGAWIPTRSTHGRPPPPPPRCLRSTEPTDNKKGTIKVSSRVKSLIFAPVGFYCDDWHRCCHALVKGFNQTFMRHRSSCWSTQDLFWSQALFAGVSGAFSLLGSCLTLDRLRISDEDSRNSSCCQFTISFWHTQGDTAPFT